MNVLYIAPYRQADEWGVTSRGFLKILKNLNSEDQIKLVSRPIWFSGSIADTKDLEEFEDIESNSLESKDILIQYGLPDHLVYRGDFKKNIAITSVDCEIEETDWVVHLNLFDQVIVFSEHEKEILIKSGVKTEIFAFTFPPFYFGYLVEEKIDLKLNNKTKFYANAPLDDKSGFRETITAYLSSFNILDDVILVLFSNDSDEIKKEIDKAKFGLGMYADDSMYPNIAIVNASSTEIMNWAHENLDCYIDVSYNGRVSQNVLKAISKDNLVIVLDTFSNIISKDYPLSVESYSDTCCYLSRPINFLYTGDSEWKKPLVKSLSASMRRASSEDLEVISQDLMALKNKLFSLPYKKTKEALCLQ